MIVYTIEVIAIHYVKANKQTFKCWRRETLKDGVSRVCYRSSRVTRAADLQPFISGLLRDYLHHSGRHLQTQAELELHKEAKYTGPEISPCFPSIQTPCRCSQEPRRVSSSAAKGKCKLVPTFVVGIIWQISWKLL